MNGQREIGGVVLAFAGFVLLVGGFKGTWRNAWSALFTGGRSATGSSSSSTASGASVGYTFVPAGGWVDPTAGGQPGTTAKGQTTPVVPTGPFTTFPPAGFPATSATKGTK